MDVALTPLEFARRARAPVRRPRGRRRRRAAADLRSSSSTAAIAGRAALQPLGVRPGDRVAYIAPNTHAQLESFYAVPQIGAVLVPINYRLSADDFAYIIDHSGRECRVRARRLPRGRRRRSRPARRGRATSWRSRARATAGSTTRRSWPRPRRPSSRPAIGEQDLLTINYTSGTTSRPKGVMITHRNAYMNVVGTLDAHADDDWPTVPVDAADVPRQRLDFTWTVTAVGAAHVCLRKVEPRRVFEAIAGGTASRCSARRRRC